MFDDIPSPDMQAKTELASLFFGAADTLFAPETDTDKLRARQLLVIARDIAATSVAHTKRPRSLR